MEPIVLRDPASGSRARLAPELGFNCFEFQANFDGQAVDVIDAAAGFSTGAGPPSHHGIPLLFPFPNRIRGGEFTWDGRSYRMTPDGVAFDPAGNAIHGFCLDRPWRVTLEEEHTVVGEFQLSRDAPERLTLWPADFRLEVRYTVRGAALRADVRITNPGEAPLPWGFGTHPYFRLPLAATSDPQHCLVEVPASELWELLPDCLPTGRRLPVPEEKDLRDGAYVSLVKLDDVYTSVSPAPGGLRCLIMDEQAGLEVVQRAGPGFREIVAYTPPDRNAVCLEPYTCVTDAVNLHGRGIDAGWRTLAPGEEFRTWIEIAAGRVLA